ncbi:MAG: hypothetical protein ABI914_02685 [Acidobacteriota bacterium]
MATHPTGLRAESSAEVLARTGVFEFHGGFWTDLHHFLYVVARSRTKARDVTRPAVLPAPREFADARLSSEERQAMEAALAIYGKDFAARDLVFDAIAARESWSIDRLGSQTTAAGAGIAPDLVRALDMAAPVWRREFWPRHLARHRAWIDEALPILEKHSDNMVRGIENAYGVRWPAGPLRVDLVAYSNWAGAYTVAKPPHVTVSTTDPTYGAPGVLEMLFHEASHTFDDHLDGLLAEEGRRQGRSIPGNLEHAIVFDTAGELAARHIPGYVVVGERAGVFSRGEWWRDAFVRIWHPHVAGRVPLADALRDLVAAVGPPVNTATPGPATR